MKELLLAAAALALTTASALAHATLAEREVTQGSTARLTLRVPHGCDGQSTLRVRIQIPEGVIAVKPMPKAGWTLEIVTGPYENSYDYYGNTLTEGVREIVWTGELPDAFYDEFVFRGSISYRIEVGQTLYIPAVQECADGAERWIEIPAAGQDGDDLEGPAPGVLVVPAKASN